MADVPPEVVDELYAAPVAEFIALRDARAKELRSGGDRAVADAVKKLRKPSVSAAAVNRLARDRSDEMSSLLAAGEALRQAQLGGGDRDAIRSAAADERAAVDRLVAEAGAYGLSAAALDEVRSTLHAAALDDAVREDVRRGVLVEPRQAMGLGGFGGAVTRPRAGGSGSARERAAAEPTPDVANETKPRPKAATKAGAKQAAAERKAAAAAERAAEAERKRAAKERVKAAKAALREAEKAAKAAERERDQAAKTLEKAERAAEKAATEADRAREELKAAESG